MSTGLWGVLEKGNRSHSKPSNTSQKQVLPGQHNGNPDQLERKFSYSSFKKHSGSKDDIISSSKLIESVSKKFPFFEIRNIVVDAWGRDSQI